MHVEREVAEPRVRGSFHGAGAVLAPSRFKARALHPGENGSRLHHMPRKSVVKSRCALCGAKEVSEPRGEESYCRDCWDKKIAVEEIVAREFALKRYIRAHSAEKYLIYHSTLKRPCGQLIVVDDGYDLFLTLMLYPNFGWDEPAYHLEGDPKGACSPRSWWMSSRPRSSSPGAAASGTWKSSAASRPSPRIGTGRCEL